MASQDQLTIRLNPSDNVVVARTDILPGTEIASEGVTAGAHIPGGHKVATAPIEPDQPIRKYNQIIGFATQPIAPGAHVHSENCEFRSFERDYAFCEDKRPTQYFTGDAQATFEGYVRANGSVGTRNYIGILTSVNCSATVARYIADAFPQEELDKYPNVDGVVSFVHSTGCGMADSGEGYANLQRVLWGFARHPNFAGILMVGLGCEVNQIDFLLEAYDIKPGPAFQTMTIQGTGGTRKTVQKGIELIKGMLPAANAYARENRPRQPSDPGAAVRRIRRLFRHHREPVAGRGRRSAGAPRRHRHSERNAGDLWRGTPADTACGQRRGRPASWSSGSSGGKTTPRSTAARWTTNPSPGNKKGGLTTILEKSLGAAAKGGTTNLAGVYKYAETIRDKGFVFMDSPGYDPCSITGQVAAGANVVCFTTGRGSVYGCKPSPSMKLATNSAMFARMDEDMDINCGQVMDGAATIPEMGEQIFNRILQIASGSPTKSEALGFGDDEFIPWQIGAVM